MPYRWTLTNLNTLDSEVLTADPIGWDSAVYSLKRSDKYKSVMHEYSSPLKFHCQGGGKQFIDAIYNANDIDGRIDILVEYDCDGSGVYDTLFNGIINLATYSIENDYTVCQIERADLYSKFISRDEISVNLETTISIGGATISAVDSIDLPLTASVIEYNDRWRTGENYVYSYDKPAQTIGDPINIPESQFDFTLDSSDINQAYSTAGATMNQTGYTVSPLIRFNDNGISYPIQVDFTFKFKGTLEILKTYGDRLGEGPQNIKLALFYGADLQFATQYVFFDDTAAASDDITYPFDVDVSDTITINAGDSIWISFLVSDVFQIATTNTFTLDEPGIFTIKSDTSYKSTSAKSFLIHEAFNQVVDAIADTNGNFVSNFYGRTDSAKQTYAANGCGAFIAVTNGLNIRQFAGKPIYASFSELFNAMDAIHNLGAGYVNGKIQVEPLAFWYDKNTKIISLPFVNQYSVKISLGMMYNKILIGYDKWETEFHGGLDEPNSKHEYSTIISSAKNIYNKLCGYITGSYAIEFTRRKNVALKGTEDWRFDNDNFLIGLVKKVKVSGRFRDTINTIEIGAIIPALVSGETFTVSGTTSNNGTFTVDTVVTYPDTGNSVITVLETVTVEIAPNFIIEGNSVGLFGAETYTDSFSSGTGMTGLTTAKNLRFTPARMLLAHINVITAGLKRINGFISFVKGEGNTVLEVKKTDVGCQEDYSGLTLSESQSFTWNDGSAANISPLYMPDIYSFEYPLTYQQFKTIKSNPNGYIEFYRFENDKKAGFILDMEYNLKTGLTKFELLRVNVD